ncbi:MAG: Septum formation protein Maf [Anaerolineales bacterium]|nr:Septum formation protein Maf [Anaerolineales bacterium]
MGEVPAGRWGLGVLEFSPMHANPLLVLGSNSPRRKELIALGGWDFEVIVADVDESVRGNESPREYVLRLAEEKARVSASRAKTDQIVLAADTTVAADSSILGKPANPSEAKRMLNQLRGRVHQVYTGIAALRVGDGVIRTDICVTDVPMRDYSNDEIESYVASGDPLDKAGAYAIQHPRFQPVAAMSGCYASVMGLPMCHVARMLKQLGFPPHADVPSNCQLFLKYRCPVFADILKGIE